MPTDRKLTLQDYFSQELPQKRAKRQIQMCLEHLKRGTRITKITNVHTSEWFSQKICCALSEEPMANQSVLVFCVFIFVQKQDEYTNSGFTKQLAALGKN